MREDQDRSTVTYAAWSGGFTPGELDAITAYDDGLTQDKADILGGGPGIALNA